MSSAFLLCPELHLALKLEGSVFQWGLLPGWSRERGVHGVPAAEGLSEEQPGEQPTPG